SPACADSATHPAAIPPRATRRRDPMEVMVPGSETDQLRQQLLQAQKLSSVVALASSVAHEFNNILTTIINYALLPHRPNQDEASRAQAIEKILKGSQRAATIISSMLGF